MSDPTQYVKWEETIHSIWLSSIHTEDTPTHSPPSLQPHVTKPTERSMFQNPTGNQKGPSARLLPHSDFPKHSL